ncbi:MAG: damage-control phosphatase ARMT1 family protein [Candidatus Promineifilaceae bacterium]
MSRPQPESPPRPLPEPLRGRETGTFTHTSIVERLPEIGRRTLAENHFPAETAAAIEALIAEIPGAPLRPIRDPTAPDAAAWDGYFAAHQGQNWLDAPWFFAEMYFYRRILEASGYFRAGPGWQVDPFTLQKYRGLDASDATSAQLAGRLSTLLEAQEPAAGLGEMFQAALWSNQGDLSIWPVGDEEQPSHAGPAARRAHTLVDDSAAAARLLLERPGKQVALLLDNASYELVADLALAAFLLGRDLAASISLHVKSHPVLVSDALIEDVHETVEALAESDDPAAARLGRQARAWLDEGRLALHGHFFWTSPLPAWEMPADLRQTLAAAGLVISKGDAHYRRLLGDRHWPYTTPFEAILGYFPAPLVALRALKSEVMAGLRPEQIEAAAERDPDWLFSGRWAAIQFARPEA